MGARVDAPLHQRWLDRWLCHASRHGIANQRRTEESPESPGLPPRVACRNPFRPKFAQAHIGSGPHSFTRRSVGRGEIHIDFHAATDFLEPRCRPGHGGPLPLSTRRRRVSPADPQAQGRTPALEHIAPGRSRQDIQDLEALLPESRPSRPWIRAAPARRLVPERPRHRVRLGSPRQPRYRPPPRSDAPTRKGPASPERNPAGPDRTAPDRGTEPPRRPVRRCLGQSGASCRGVVSRNPRRSGQRAGLAIVPRVSPRGQGNPPRAISRGRSPEGDLPSPVWRSRTSAEFRRLRDYARLRG